jgi:hypothetical protein
MVNTVTRMYTGDDGDSCLQTFSIPTGGSRIGSVSDYIPVTRMRFRRRDKELPIGYLNAPFRQFAIIIAGGVEIEVGNGIRKRFGPGDVIFAEDISGTGHIARVENFVEQFYVEVPDSFDFSAWATAVDVEDVL